MALPKRQLRNLTLSWFLLVEIIFSRTSALRSDQCPVCWDGSTPLESDEILDEAVFGGGVSCNTLSGLAVDLLNNTAGCDALQLTAFQAGCCESYPPQVCQLCPDESVVTSPTTEVPFDDGSVTCESLTTDITAQMDLLKDFRGTPGTCENTVLRRSAGWCGCSGVGLECDLCNGAELLEEEFILTGTSCNDVAYEVSLLAFEQCPNAESLLGFDPRALCCPGTPKPETCKLCAESRQLFVPGATVTTPSYGHVSCADVEEAATLIATEAACQSLRQETGGACCMDLPEIGPCELTCPDGSPPPDLFKTDPSTGRSCESLANDYDMLSEDECPDAVNILGFDAPAFCCPEVDPPSTCIICGTGQQLLYPERLLVAFHDVSCLELESSLEFVVGEVACQSILDESLATRNCECRSGILPSPSPTFSPTSTDSRGSSSSRFSFQHTIWITTATIFVLGYRRGS